MSKHVHKYYIMQLHNILCRSIIFVDNLQSVPYLKQIFFFNRPPTQPLSSTDRTNDLMLVWLFLVAGWRSFLTPAVRNFLNGEICRIWI